MAALTTHQSKSIHKMQRQLALMTGASRSYLWKIEIGAADVGIDVLVRIARALDVPVRDLIEF